MIQVEVNDVRYACQIPQRNETLPWLLMLHGFMGDHRVFDHLTDKLSSFCNPVAIDLLGFGQSSKPEDPERYREQKQIRDLCDLITALDIQQPLLFGYSMGGRLALQTAIAQQERFSGLLLESATCGIDDPQKRNERQKLDAQWAHEIQTDFDAFLSEWQELELFQSPKATDHSLARKYQKIQSEQTPSALAASLHGFGTGSMRPVCDKLPQLNLPILLLAGTADQKYQQVNRYLLEQLPNATFSSIEAGHRTHLDNPSAFASELQAFVTKL